MRILFYTFIILSNSLLAQSGSTNRMKNTVKLKVGDTYQGGIIFRLDKTLKHGLVVTDFNVRDSVVYGEAEKISDTITINGFKGWSMPTIDDWLYANANVNDSNLTTINGLKSLGFIKLNNLYYWTKSPKGDTKEYAFLNGYEASEVLWSTQRNKTKLPFILIRKF